MPYRIFLTLSERKLRKRVLGGPLVLGRETVKYVNRVEVRTTVRKRLVLFFNPERWR